MDTDIEARVRGLEQSMAVVKDQVDRQDRRTTGLEDKIDRLQRSILAMGISIVGSILLMLIGIIGYFMVQKDAQLEALKNLTVQIERSSGAKDGSSTHYTP